MYNRQPVMRISQSESMPAPTGGVNDIDAIPAMGEQFLVDSMNFFPDTGLLVARPGYREWVTGFGLPVKTLMYYYGRVDDQVPFAATDAGIYDVSVSTDTPVVAHPLTDGMCQFTNFANTLHNYLVVCNGTDAACLFNGTTWVNFDEVVTPTDPGQISGVDPALFAFPLGFKHRLWFIQKNSMTAWYLPLDSVGGVATPFFLGGVFSRGGHLVAMVRWSSDTGTGLDDRLVFITSAGEIASYSGNNPNDANDWRLDAVFFVAPPVSMRAATDYGGDVLYLTRRGLIPLSSLVSGTATEVLYSGALTRRISRTLLKLTSDPAPLFPGEITVHNEAAWVIINLFDSSVGSSAPYDHVLSAGNNQPIQLVMNSLTGAWGKFNLPIRTMRSINGLFYMGTDDGRVLVITPDNYLDEVKVNGTGGVPIDLYAMAAFTYLGNRQNNKHTKFVRPTIQSNATPAVKMRVVPNFELNRYNASPSASSVVAGSVWDGAEWDVDIWAGTSNVYRPWISANVLGYAFSWQLRASTATSFGLSAVDYVWETGGFV